MGTMFGHVLMNPFQAFVAVYQQSWAMKYASTTRLVGPVASHAAALRVVSVGNSSLTLSFWLVPTMKLGTGAAMRIRTPWFEVRLEAQAHTCPDIRVHLWHAWIWYVMVYIIYIYIDPYFVVNTVGFAYVYLYIYICVCVFDIDLVIYNDKTIYIYIYVCVYFIVLVYIYIHACFQICFGFVRLSTTFVWHSFFQLPYPLMAFIWAAVTYAW